MEFTYVYEEVLGKSCSFIFLSNVDEFLKSKQTLRKSLLSKEVIHQTTSKMNPAVYQRVIYIPCPSEIFQECKVGSTHKNQAM